MGVHLEVLHLPPYRYQRRHFALLLITDCEAHGRF
jgi:hypothetical protein